MLIDYLDIYENLLPGKLPPEVRYVIVMGGRGSAKSFHASTALVKHAEQDQNTILFTRYTMVAADISIIPEFTEKIEMLNAEGFTSKATEINHALGGKILFRGIMQGSRNQTARLKSIPNVKLFVLDEAEELTSETTFDTIDFSLRKIGIHAQLWMILNPPDVSHWIFRRFVSKVYNLLKPNTVTIVGDTCFIWTTYQVNERHLDSAFLAQIEKMREFDYEKYKNIFLGYWNVRKEGLIYRNWEQIQPQDWPIGLPFWYGLDWGYGGDPTAILAMAYYPIDCTLYVREVAYAKGMLIPQIAQTIIADGKAHGLDASHCEVYCDPARPDNRDQLRMCYSINAINGINRDKSGRIAYLQGFKVKYIGENMHQEVSTYSWMPNPNDTSTFTDKPQDGGDHLCDAASYASARLRAMGIANASGNRQ